MLYFFTDKQKKEIKKEYNVRLANTVLISLSIVFLFGIISMIPTYYFLFLEKKTLTEEVEVLAISNSANDRESLRNEISDINHKIQLLGKEDRIVSELVKEITDRQLISIKINVIEFMETETGPQIRLQGVSNNRESLVEFGNILEESDLFESVEFPVSSFTRSSDIPFVLNMKVTEKKDD